MQVWRRQRRGRALSNMWTSSLVLSCPIDDEAAAAARRRRRAPPNPSINQVAWTMDDNKVPACCLEMGLCIPHAHPSKDSGPNKPCPQQEDRQAQCAHWCSPTVRFMVEAGLYTRQFFGATITAAWLYASVRVGGSRYPAIQGVELLVQVLAAISDNTVAVWDAHRGDLSQRLHGHTSRAHVLECHPTDPRLAMSAGYDGQTIVWDLVEGEPLARCVLLCWCSLKLVCSQPSSAAIWNPHTPPSADAPDAAM